MTIAENKRFKKFEWMAWMAQITSISINGISTMISSNPVDKNIFISAQSVGYETFKSFKQI